MARERRVIVRLTDAGRAVIDDVAGRIFDRGNELLAGLSPEQRQALAANLERLVRAVADPGPIEVPFQPER